MILKYLFFTYNTYIDIFKTISYHIKQRILFRINCVRISFRTRIQFVCLHNRTNLAYLRRSSYHYLCYIMLCYGRIHALKLINTMVSTSTLSGSQCHQFEKRRAQSICWTGISVTILHFPCFLCCKLFLLLVLKLDNLIMCWKAKKKDW